MPLRPGAKVSADGDMFALPSKVYPTAVHMISMENYQQEVLTGFVVSAGGLGESLVCIPSTC